jgi:hypothetical protein
MNRRERKREELEKGRGGKKGKVRVEVWIFCKNILFAYVEGLLIDLLNKF